jgi:phospholipase/lecithinase/hemolysin
VRFQPDFDAATKRAPADYWIWDNVHPTYRGHQLMADEWERVVRDFWKQESSPTGAAQLFFCKMAWVGRCRLGG